MTFTIDFDNTCAFEDFPNVGKSVPFAVDVITKLQKDGHKIVLWTCRQNESLERAVKWFVENNIKLDGINEYPVEELTGELATKYGVPRKVVGDINIDDKNLGCPKRLYEDPDTHKEYWCVDWYKVAINLIADGIINSSDRKISEIVKQWTYSNL